MLLWQDWHKISQLLNYADNTSSYEPEIILARNATPTLVEGDIAIVAIEARTGDESSHGLLWYEVN